MMTFTICIMTAVIDVSMYYGLLVCPSTTFNVYFPSAYNNSAKTVSDAAVSTPLKFIPGSICRSRLLGSPPFSETRILLHFACCIGTHISKQ